MRNPAYSGHLRSVNKSIHPRRNSRSVAVRADHRVNWLPNWRRYYGHEFNDLTYIPGMSLIGQMRLGNIAEVEKLVQPWVEGPKAGTPDRPASQNLAGYLVFAELG